MNELHSLPHALILCADERMARLLENELTLLGVQGRTVTSLPTAAEELCLVIADGDAFPLTDCESLTASAGCPLLVFGRTPPPPSSNVSFLRRPFALTDLEQIVASLPNREQTGRRERITPVKEEAAPPVPPPSLVLKGDAATIGIHRVPLTPAEQAILSCLLSHRGQAVPRDTLAALLEGGGNSVDVYVCRLRAKIEKPLGRRMITTVRGVGYCLND